MKFSTQIPGMVHCFVNGVDTIVPGSTGDGAPTEMTEKQIADAKKAGKVVVAFDDTVQLKTVTVLKSDLEIIAAKAGIIIEKDMTGDDLCAAISAEAKKEQTKP